MATCDSHDVDLVDILEPLLSPNDTERRHQETLILSYVQRMTKFVPLLIIYAIEGCNEVYTSYKHHLLKQAESGNMIVEEDEEEQESILLGESSPLGSAVKPDKGGGEDCHTSQDLNLRCLAAILAKNLIRDHYLQPTDIDLIKSVLLKNLFFPHAVIRDTLHLIVTDLETAHPWPELFQALRYLLNQHKDQTEKTLTLLHLLTTMAENCVPNCQLPVKLLGQSEGIQEVLLHLASGMPQFNFDSKQKESTISNVARCEALKIYLTCLENVVMNGSMDDITELIAPALDRWTQLFCDVIQEFVSVPTDLDRVKRVIVILKTIGCIFRISNDSLLQGLIPVIGLCLEGCLEALDLYYPYYENMVLNDVDDTAAVEESVDGGPINLIVQICHVLIHAVQNPVIHHVLIQGHIQDILGAVFKFLQVTQLQCMVWLEDANEFLSHEETESWLDPSPRLAGLSLIQVLLKEDRSATLSSLADAISLFIALSKERQDESAESNWWKPLELALWLTEFVAETLHELEAEERQQYSLVMELAILTMGRLLSDPLTPPILKSRALLASSKLNRLIAEKYPFDLCDLLDVFSRLIDLTKPPPVRLAACRALASFLKVQCLPKTCLEGLIVKWDLFAHLAACLCSAQHEEFCLYLETLTCIVQFFPEATSSMTPEMIQQILRAWQRSTSDLIVNLCFQEFVQAACDTDTLLKRTLEQQNIPALVTTFTDGVPPLEIVSQKADIRIC